LGLLRVDPERRFFTAPQKTGLGAAERVNLDGLGSLALFKLTSKGMIDFEKMKRYLISRAVLER